MLNWSFIQELEGFRTTGYVPDQGSSQSGVTIGYGVDLGHWSEAQLRRRKASPHLIEKLRTFLGLRGDDAIEVADELVLDEDDARNLSSRIQGDIVATLMGRYARAQKAGTLRWDYLPSAVQTVIVSVAFQYGPALARRTPKFWRAAVANDWSAMVAELRDFGDRYPTRRGKEADYLEHILKS
jgi:GH24 family phage-related lysozyme (muramidase)